MSGTRPVSIFLLACLILTIDGGQLPDDIRDQIHANQADVTRIINHVRDGPAKHHAHSRLANITDWFGPRATGTQALEDSIDYAVRELTNAGFDVHTENVTAEKWTRNKESAAIVAPRFHQMGMMSLGSSVPGNIEAEVLTVKDYADLDAQAAQNPGIFTGKIILYNNEWVGYGDTVIYRNTGASRAAQYGAIGALIRSVTQFSIYSPHTGVQTYNTTVSNEKIPIAAITVEDAHQIQRYIDQGHTVRVNLNMTCVNQGNITTRNVIADLKGSEFPNEIVMIGGHIDSWDVGFGVMDDGGGVMISWQALLNLKALNLTPRRTIRAIFWTAEEIGLIGAEQYYARHKANHGNYSIIMESDAGTFKPRGIGFTGSGKARDILSEIGTMLVPVDAGGVTDDGTSPDTGMWQADNVPLGNLWNANEQYFYFHHTHGDSITMEDPDDLDLCAIVWTVVPYVIANMDEKLPRTGTYPDPPVGIGTRAGSEPMMLVLAASLVFAIIHIKQH